MPSNERQSNTDPREQTPAQEYTSHFSEEGQEQGYEQGYTGLNERDFWQPDGEKLRPEPKNQKGMGGLLALIVLLCIGVKFSKRSGTQVVPDLLLSLTPTQENSGLMHLKSSIGRHASSNCSMKEIGHVVL